MRFVIVTTLAPSPRPPSSFFFLNLAMRRAEFHSAVFPFRTRRRPRFDKERGELEFASSSTSDTTNVRRISMTDSFPAYLRSIFLTENLREDCAMTRLKIKNVN